MQKTVMVEIARTTRHPKYHKDMRRVTRLMAHDEAEVLVQGDKVLRPPAAILFRGKPTLSQFYYSRRRLQVRIQRCRPLSKNKHYMVTEKVVNVEGQEVYTPLAELHPGVQTAPPPIVR